MFKIWQKWKVLVLLCHRLECFWCWVSWAERSSSYVLEGIRVPCLTCWSSRSTWLRVRARLQVAYSPGTLRHTKLAFFLLSLSLCVNLINYVLQGSMVDWFCFMQVTYLFYFCRSIWKIIKMPSILRIIFHQMTWEPLYLRVEKIWKFSSKRQVHQPDTCSPGTSQYSNLPWAEPAEVVHHCWTSVCTSVSSALFFPLCHDVGMDLFCKSKLAH